MAQDSGTPAKSKDAKKVSKELYKEENEEKEPIRRWEFGIGFGACFPAKFSANYYNGTPANINNVIYVMSNKYWYRDIKYALGSADTVLINGYPTNMKYQVSFMGGLFVRFNFDKRNSMILQANYTRLKAEDVVTFEVDPKSYLTFKDLRLIPIVGREGRVMIDLGYQHSFPLGSNINFFLQAGGTMCYTQVIKSMIVVEGTEYSLINVYGNQYYVPNSNMETQYVNQNGFGFGGFLGTGFGIPLTDLFGIEPGFYGQYYPVNIEGYNRYRPSFGAYLRIMLYPGQKEQD